MSSSDSMSGKFSVRFHAFAVMFEIEDDVGTRRTGKGARPFAIASARHGSP